MTHMANKGKFVLDSVFKLVTYINLCLGYGDLNMFSVCESAREYVCSLRD